MQSHKLRTMRYDVSYTLAEFPRGNALDRRHPLWEALRGKMLGVSGT